MGRIGMAHIGLLLVLLTACQNSAQDDVPVSGSGSPHYLATQYWTWYTAGSGAPMWAGVDAYGTPSELWYDSNDPVVAARHISAMTSSGINALSVGYFAKAGDGTCWNADIIDPDQAFRNGIMKASNFSTIKFFVSYDLATRAMLVHRAENGLQWGFPAGKDVLPNVAFFDPVVDASQDKSGFPSFDFNLKDTNGKYIYDELMLYDFKNFAENYFNKPNYLKINGQAVVFLYNSWRFNNGGTGGPADGFARAFKKIRESMYVSYGQKIYLAGDFVSWYNRDKAEWYRTMGYFQHYDAVHGWNVYDDTYRSAFGDWTSLSDYTDRSESTQDAFRIQAALGTRNYRIWLSEPTKSAYGTPGVAIDYLPLLAFSFRRHDGSSGFKSSSSGTEEVIKELEMVKRQRSLSPLAENEGTLTYHISFNQWNEGQIIEPASADAASPYPGKYGWTYLNKIEEILGEW